MEENIKNNVVDQAFEELVDKAENLDKAIVQTAATLPAVAQTKTPTNKTTVVIGVSSLLGGLAVGAALDHWVAPAVSNWWEEKKVERAKKKEERRLKKEAKKAAKAAKEAPAPEPATTVNDAPDPREHDTKID